jgi:hypothetical protein
VHQAIPLRRFLFNKLISLILIGAKDATCVLKVISSSHPSAVLTPLSFNLITLWTGSIRPGSGTLEPLSGQLTLVSTHVMGECADYREDLLERYGHTVSCLFTGCGNDVRGEEVQCTFQIFLSISIEHTPRAALGHAVDCRKIIKVWDRKGHRLESDAGC